MKENLAVNNKDNRVFRDWSISIGGWVGANGGGSLDFPRLLPNGRLGRLSRGSGQLKFSSRSPNGRLNMEFSFPSNLSGDFNLLKKSSKKSFTQYVKQKTTAPLVLFCFLRSRGTRERILILFRQQESRIFGLQIGRPSKFFQGLLASLS